MLDPTIEYEVHVDGEAVDMDDFTFEEQDDYRALVRESAGNPDLAVVLAENMDRWPAMVTVVKRRTNSDFTLADAKSLKTNDILRPLGSGKKRPTKGAQKAS
jgi:hypothetical protein